MAATRALAQVVTVVALVLLASVTPSRGGFLGSRGSPPDDEDSGPLTFPNPLSIPKKVISAFSTGSRGQTTTVAAPTQHQHPHVSSAKPAAAAPTAAASTSTTTTTAAPTTPSSTTAAAKISPTAAATPASAEVTAAAQEGDSMAETRTADHGNYTKEQYEKCRESWLQVANSTVSESLDILSVLVENGGIPGQLSGDNIKWERNATAGHPNRWTYFYGDTDYKTFIRVERGEINSKTYPAQGASPEAISGDVYWSPDDFCGKLRHAKYTQDTELRATNQPKVCFIEDDRARVTCWSAPECVEPQDPGVVCPRGGVSGALMASLVG